MKDVQQGIVRITSLGWHLQNYLRNSYDHYLGWVYLQREQSELFKLPFCS
jgi:hypothetical protein